MQLTNLLIFLSLSLGVISSPVEADNAEQSPGFTFLDKTPFGEPPDYFEKHENLDLLGPDANPECHVSNASPSINDVRDAINKMASWTQYMCDQKNARGSMCTQLVNVGGAQISVCGPTTWAHSCPSVARMARRVLDGCQWNGKSGGKFKFHYGKNWGDNFVAVH